MSCCCGGEKARRTEEGDEGGWARLDARLEGLCEAAESWWVVTASGLCVLAGFVLHVKGGHVGCEGGSPWWDPALVSVLLCGLPMAYRALKALFVRRRITSGLLITLAMAAAIAIGELFAAGEVAFIMAIGEKLEDFTVGRAAKGVKGLVRLKEAMKKDVAVGDIVAVAPGEAFPCDGVVTGGETTVDQSIVTGESVPVRKVAGDPVYTGTLNRYGRVEIRATAVGADTSLEKIIRLVNEANNHKAPMQRLADRWASILVPAALCVALATLVVCHFALGIGLRASLTRAVTVLVTFCPCALALATPTSVMAAIGQATKRGVLVKTGEALERMGAVDTVTFDKTGTLTKGTWANALARDADGRILAGANMDVADELRETAPETVRRLRALGVRSYLLTGDHREIAETFAAACGIADVRADLLPEEIAWRQKEQFSDGVGYSWIDTLKRITSEQVSDEQMAHAAERFPIHTPLCKEEYFYRSIFEEHFPSRSAALSVNQEASVACSTSIALEWDAAWKQMNDPSGRAVSGVHQQAY